MSINLKIPGIAKGTVIPAKIEMDMLKNEQERKETKRRDRIAVWTLVVAVLTLIATVVIGLIK